MNVRRVPGCSWLPTCLALGLMSGCRADAPSVDVSTSETTTDSDDTDDDTTDGESTVDLDGAVQKGPFILGSTISIAPLDDAGNPTGDAFATQTINDRGEFSVSFDAVGSVSLEGTGFYYNEATGALSAAPLTLRAVYVIEQPGPQSATINLFTHLAFNRVKQLLAQGVPYLDALTQAEHELVLALDIGYDGFEPQAIGVELDLAGGDTDPNAYLLAVSSVLAQAAVEAAGGPMGPVDARLQEIANSISLDLADDGTLDGPLVNQLASARHLLDTDAIEAALAARFLEIDEVAPVPDMDRVLDQDDDGVHNNDDNCRKDANPGQEDGDADDVGDICDPCPVDADNVGGVGCPCEGGGPECNPGLSCPAWTVEWPPEECGVEPFCPPEVCMPTSIVSLSTGHAQTCVLLSTGAVRCWGSNSSGSVGYPDLAGSGSPAPFGDLDLGPEPARSIDVGAVHACAEFLAEMRCWGSATGGQLGYGNLENIGDDEPPSAAGPVNLSGWSIHTIAAGEYGTCAVRNIFPDHHVVKCWGRTLGDNEVPASIPSFILDTNVEAIDIGNTAACVLLTGGAVRCWGDNLDGSLGYGVPVSMTLEQGPGNVGDVSLGGPATQIELGRAHGCALMQDATVRCWGNNLFGQLGLGNTTNIGDNEVPTSVGPIALGAPAVQVTAGAEHSCALLQGGDVRCWGEGDDGRLGHGSTTDIGDDELPTAIPVIDLGAPAVQVSAGARQTCALLDTNDVRCWGEIFVDGINVDYIGDDEPASAAPLIDVI